MILTDDEKAMLDGKEGKTRQKAIEFLVKYGTALGAERLVNTNNVGGYMIADRASYRKFGSFDALFSLTGLDSEETLEFPKVKAFSCQFETDMDPEYCDIEGKDEEDYRRFKANEEWLSKIGVQLMCTCTPYLVGNVPVKGEHCAWMESSAVVYINSVLGARTNCEGNTSTTAAMLTGKIPYWGFHTDEHRLGSHLVNVELKVEGLMEWGLLGYYIGKMVGEKVPVLDGIKIVPSRDELKQFGAATASSGGVEMYHIPGITADAHTVEEAFGGRTPAFTLKYGPEERKYAYEQLNMIGKNTDVDFVMFGCPHNSIQQVQEICDLLEGKRIKGGSSLWVLVPRAIKDLAKRNGYDKVIESAGGVLMSDTCPALGHLMPKGTRVLATNSAKQAHYLPSMMGIESWYGTTEECVNAAVTGRWEGALK
ncbi:predicted aconitase subunit 1 [Sporobacter termitidis DSM 10068]|uniref:Predicted aconitase subunit 1 n=1 Tax=Sporobacter termitidis DSM 10068 TaxID=1123282 RepID=A0A1M5XU26_9FIRM|nr:aconitase X catalytic domain-containing protein [Sporobacter termitidis]SHI03028.1 predicted aconitase subunit 1 [Sporobacter termitidis DSM 10068]